MKNLLSATLPALALLALGGCASTGALTTSTETDGVYYSSKDYTTTIASPAGVYSGNGAYGSSGTIPAKALDDTAPAPVATTDDANPDYQGGTTTQAAAGSDYYSNSYSSYNNASGFGQPYTGPGVSSFNYTPSASYAVSPSYYGSPYGYASAFGYGYSPFSMGYGYGMGGFGYPYGGFYDPFYSSFYSPFGYGSGLSIGFGYGLGGFGGFGSPYGYGFGGFGSPYGYGYSPFYGNGGYGRGYYDAGYARPVIYTRGAGISSPGAGAVLYGSRSNRGGAVLNASNAVGNPNSANIGNGRGSYTGNAVALPSNAVGAATTASPMPTGRGGRAVNFGGTTGQPTYSTPAGQASNAVPNASPRRGFFGGFFGNGSGGGTPTAGQPTTAGQPAGGYGSRQRNANYGQPQTQRSYSQPTYSQPQMQRSYSQPTYSQPSRSYGGSFGGGGSGGGNFGGGGGGGGGRGRR